MAPLDTIGEVKGSWTEVLFLKRLLPRVGMHAFRMACGRMARAVPSDFRPASAKHLKFIPLWEMIRLRETARFFAAGFTKKEAIAVGISLAMYGQHRFRSESSLVDVRVGFRELGKGMVEFTFDLIKET